MIEEENDPVLHRSGDQLQARLEPIVLKYKKRKMKSKDADETSKPKYSKGLEDIQLLEGDMVRIAQRTSKAVAKGIDTYERERKRSSKEKKDGAIEDFLNNSAKAASDFMKETSEFPLDLANMMNKKSYRKRVRTGLRRTSRIIRMWRI